MLEVMNSNFFHPIPSHPIPSHPIPSHPIFSFPLDTLLPSNDKLECQSKITSQWAQGDLMNTELIKETLEAVCLPNH